jgi:hypothetical protein
MELKGFRARMDQPARRAFLNGTEVPADNAEAGSAGVSA